MNRNTLIVIAVALVVVGGAVFVMKNDKKAPDAVATAPSGAAPTAAPPTVAAPPPAVVNTPAPPVSIDPAQVQPVASGAPLDMATVALEAKMISNAQSLLEQGKPREALQQIEDYEKIPDRAALVPEAKFLKIEALGRAGGRRTDALTLAMATRDDPAMAPYQSRIESFLADAGISGGVTSPSQ